MEENGVFQGSDAVESGAEEQEMGAEEAAEHGGIGPEDEIGIGRVLTHQTAARAWNLLYQT